MSEEKVVTDDVTDVNGVDIPEVADKSGPRPLFNRDRGETKETGEEKRETDEHPMSRYISHRHNISDNIRQTLITVRDGLNEQTYRSYQARDFWKKKYNGGLEITEDDINKTLDSTLNSGKYRGLSFRSVLSHDPKYAQWLTERNLFRNADSLQYRIIDLLLPDEHKCRFHNQEILKELREHKKEQKRKFESNYQGKYKKFKKY